MYGHLSSPFSSSCSSSNFNWKQKFRTQMENKRAHENRFNLSRDPTNPTANNWTCCRIQNQKNLSAIHKTCFSFRLSVDTLKMRLVNSLGVSIFRNLLWLKVGIRFRIAYQISDERHIMHGNVKLCKRHHEITSNKLFVKRPFFAWHMNCMHVFA